MRVPSPPKYPHTVSLAYKDQRKYPSHRKGLKQDMTTLAQRLGGRLETLMGFVIPTPRDGFTFYYDVYAEGGVATSYEGMDYGNPFFVEISAESPGRLSQIEAVVRDVFDDQFEIEIVELRQGQRDYAD